MLKGHTKIELTNVNTGEVEVHEDNNLVTNAVARTLDMMFLGGNPSNVDDILPIYTNMTSGILLFQNTLTEDINNMAIPSPTENPIIGYASNTVNTGTNTYLGSANLTETVALDNGYKYVWDFNSSQAIGTISAVALTSKYSGLLPHYRPTSPLACRGGITIALDEHIYNITDYDFENKTWTNLYMSDATTLHVEKVQMFMTTMWGMGTFGSLRILEDTIYDLSKCEVTVARYSKWIDGEDGYYYVLYSTGSTTISIVRFSKDTITYDADYGTKSFTSPGGYKYYASGNVYQGCNILNGYLYMKSSSNYLIKVNLLNMEDLTEISCSVTSGEATYLAKYNNALIIGANVIYEDLSIYKLGGISYTSYCFGNQKVKYMYMDNCGVRDIIFDITNSGNFYTETTLNYLATINNLEAPVTKTDSQTMKITYTLTEE